MKTSIVAMTSVCNNTTTHIVCTDMHMESFHIIMQTNNDRHITKMSIGTHSDEIYHIPFTHEMHSHDEMREMFGDTIASDMCTALQSMMNHELLDVHMDSFLDWFFLFQSIDHYYNHAIHNI